MNPRRFAGFAAPALAALASVALWQTVATLLPPERKFLLPTPLAVVHAFGENAPALLSATGYTLAGALLGFALAVSGSIAAALALGASTILRRSFYPYLLALQTTPIIVIAPILILWVGPGLTSVAIITFLVSFFPLVVNTTQGLVSTDVHQVELFRLYRARKWQEVLLLRLPAALPYFFTGLKIAATLAPIGAIVGDFYAGNSAGGRGGLGFLTLIFSSQFKMSALFATALVSCGLGLLFHLAATGLAWLCLHKWHDAYR
ncbi:ABC transporter permease [Nibricoccus sp. IMCC34717]|uniref:ABC transporter permease n=1 Tax=Nibricoccus sp. IMCC34717 TaxID=3034021 RepID=UPI00384F774B